jgi:predicted acetyltransferase
MEFRSLRSDELALFFDHCDVCHVETPREYFVKACADDPAFDPADILAAVDDGRIASTVRVIPRKVYLGGRAIAMGGIGDVGTRPEYRRRGLSGKLLTMAIARMLEKDMPLSVLFTGVNEHYARYGWVTLTTRHITADIPDAPLPNGVTARRVTPGDFAALRGLYDLYAPRLGGAIVRDDALYWDRWVRGKLRNAYALEADGRVQAYAAYDKASSGAAFDVTEWIAAPAMEDLLPALLAEVRRADALPGRARIDAPLWPGALGDVEEEGYFMVRLNTPITLDERLDTNEALAAAMGEPVLFATDHY